MSQHVRFVHRFLCRFRFAFRGLLVGIREDRSTMTSVYLGGGFVIFFSIMLWPLREIEILFLALSFALVLVTEFQNSSVETALDALHPNEHDGIKTSKDLAAASAFISGLFAFGIVIWILAEHGIFAL